MGKEWKSRFRKLELGMGMELTWENRERLEWNGKRRRTRERGSVPWSKLNAPRILKDGSRISCGKEGNGRSMLGSWESGVGKEGQEGTKGKEARIHVEGEGN